MLRRGSIKCCCRIRSSIVLKARFGPILFVCDILNYLLKEVPLVTQQTYFQCFRKVGFQFELKTNRTLKSNVAKPLENSIFYSIF